MSETSTRRRGYSIREAAALTGLPASTLRYYESIGVAAPVSRSASSAAAQQQIELLTAQRDRLAREAELIAVRRRYVQHKIDYWQAVAEGDDARAASHGAAAATLADEMKKPH